MITLDIVTKPDTPGATWHFSSDPECTHESKLRKAFLGTYWNGNKSGAIYGLKCPDCKGLFYA